MNWPVLKSPPVFRETTEVFRGYNRNLQVGSGEFREMENLTSDHFPVLAPRQGRGVYAETETATGLTAKDALCYVDGSRLVIDGYPVEMGLSSEGPKQLVSMGAYLVIFPDKKYINTANLSDFGPLEARFSSEGTVMLTPCGMDGSDSLPNYRQPEAPEAPENMALWLDTSETPASLKQWSASTGMWVGIAQTYVRIAAPGIGAAFRKYDGITLSGLEEDSLNGSAVIWSLDTDWIVVAGLIEQSAEQENPMKAERTLPDMDFVIESDNRLWGCRYGLSADGEPLNEIYASKLGDFRNWRCYMGLSTDSYAVSLGSDGRFTGAVTHMGYPLFFKENCLHKIYGSYPANFQLQTIPCRGVQQGSGRSLAIVGEVLYYHSPMGICAFDGSLPRDVSQNLGGMRCRNAVGAAFGKKYYVSLEQEDGSDFLLVYDTEKGLWHRESGIGAAAMCACRGQLYAIGRGGILTLTGGQEQVSWMARTGMLDGTTPDAKYLTGLRVRMSLEPGASVEFRARCDSRGAWEWLGAVSGRGTGTFTVPLRPRRCDHLELELRGKGEARIYALTKTMEQGSDVF